MTQIKFGTDGWRAIIARDFTFDNVRACAQGTAAYLKARGTADRGVVIGYDTRFGSEHFAAEIAGVLAANGVPVLLASDFSPTPVTSYNILHHKAAGGVVVTASHNPAIWNGYKFKPEYGGSASPEIVARLEEEIARAQGQEVPLLPLDRAEADGLVRRVDLREPYTRQVASLLDLDALRGAGLKVTVDAMFGAGKGYLPHLLGGGATRVTELHGERNPVFPGMHNPEPIEGNLQELLAAVPRDGADIGLAMDGDADRLGVVDERGRYLTSLQVFALLALYWLEVRGQRGPVVKSLTTSRMVNRLGELYSVPVYETPVGFKYVGPLMLEHNALIGGEESGGYGYRGHIPERDGVLSGLLLLDFMVRTGRKPSELLGLLEEKVGPHHYSRHDVPFRPQERAAIQFRLEEREVKELAGHKVAQVDAIDGRRFVMDDGAWVVVRFSGTEPLLRIYAEASSPEKVERLLAAIEELLGVEPPTR